MSVKLKTPSNGSVTLAPEDTASDVTLTVPAVAGELFGQGNILGTVSQSGGVPTGAIIERGSNANGEYVKYADGTLICTGQIIAPSGTGTGVKNQTWTFPATFINEDRLVFCNFRFASPANMDRVRYLHPDGNSTTTTSQLIGWHEGAWSQNAFGTNQPIMLQAIGRWY
jgi:hypothetical protein